MTDSKSRPIKYLSLTYTCSSQLNPKSATSNSLLMPLTGSMCGKTRTARRFSRTPMKGISQLSVQRSMSVSCFSLDRSSRDSTQTAKSVKKRTKAAMSPNPNSEAHEDVDRHTQIGTAKCYCQSYEYQCVIEAGSGRLPKEPGHYHDLWNERYNHVPPRLPPIPRVYPPRPPPLCKLPGPFNNDQDAGQCDSCGDRFANEHKGPK